MNEPVGRAKGGVARAEKLSPERLQEIARKGAQARKDLALLPKITHGSPDHPLVIFDTELPCYVLEGGIRVLSQRGVQAGIGMSTSGGVGGAHRLAQFIEGLSEKGINCNDLAVRIRNPIIFRPSGGGKPAYGYEATMLADICDAVLEARNKKLLHPQQEHFAKQCEILVRGFARVGIIALVDEATGYQRDRDKDNLAKILEAFVAKEIQPYVKTFPNEYYEELFRLYRIPYPPAGNKSWRPQFFGHITNEVVYARLAPSLIPELKKIASKADRKARLHQALTVEIGHPRLKEHLSSIVAIQKLSSTPQQFLENVNKVHRRYNQTLPLFSETEAPTPESSTQTMGQ